MAVSEDRENRFSQVEIHDEKRSHSRLVIAVAALLVLAVGGIGIVVAVAGGSAKHHATLDSASSPTLRHVPANLAPLPAVQPGVIGVVQLLQQTPGTITRGRALEDYRQTPSALSLRGRPVKTALARVAYIADGHERQTTVWIISVWYHPANIGVARQRQWCVTHQLLTASNGNSFYAAEGSCLPTGRRPVNVTARRTP
jgi:hypothetical protein